VREVAGDARLAQEALRRDRVGAQALAEHLDRDLAVELLVHAGVHHAHPAAAQHLMDAVAAVEARTDQRVVAGGRHQPPQLSVEHVPLQHRPSSPIARPGQTVPQVRQLLGSFSTALHALWQHLLPAAQRLPQLPQ
jgi:hypothetical protein